MVDRQIAAKALNDVLHDQERMVGAKRRHLEFPIRTASMSGGQIVGVLFQTLASCLCRKGYSFHLNLGGPGCQAETRRTRFFCRIAID
jgi:hypothetical protein